MKKQTVQPHPHHPRTTNSPNKPTGTLWLTIAEAAEYARVSKRTISNWREKGLPYVKRNRKSVYIKADDIDKFLMRDYSTMHPDAVDRKVNAILNDLMK